MFAMLASAQSRHGRFKASQMFIVYEMTVAAAQPGYVGGRFIARRLGHINQDEKELPGQFLGYLVHAAQPKGAFDRMNEGGVMKAVLLHHWPTKAARVRIRFLKHTPDLSYDFTGIVVAGINKDTASG